MELALSVWSEAHSSLGLFDSKPRELHGDLKGVLKVKGDITLAQRQH